MTDPREPAKFVHDTRRIISANQSACDLFKCDPVALVDLDMMELIADKELRGLARLRMRVLREAEDTNNFPTIKYPFYRCDGAIFWATVTTIRKTAEQFETTVHYEYEE